ncbi:hypothetical protein llap_19412 [Limosa lapponica baueri]|uniref:Uncharacterized protein n=1 Tax=Limosa lapponica baueri TaxID=1758121 RepID=A0A2I0T915_LIMLA|nr:hypothetical protein llap_19412 [Limosa lapponica baueri]
MFLLFSKDCNVVSLKEDVASARLQQSSLRVGRSSAAVGQFCDMKDGDVMAWQEQTLTTKDARRVDPDKGITHRSTGFKVDTSDLLAFSESRVEAIVLHVFHIKCLWYGVSKIWVKSAYRCLITAGNANLPIKGKRTLVVFYVKEGGKREKIVDPDFKVSRFTLPFLGSTLSHFQGIKTETQGPR